MARIKPLFRIVAVLNAVLLVGLYVCYRGGVVAAFGAKPAAQPSPVDPPVAPIVSTPQQEPSSVASPPAVAPVATETTHTFIVENSMNTIVRGAPEEPPPSPSTVPLPRHEVILSGSKSSPIDFSKLSSSEPKEPMEIVTPWPTKPPWPAKPRVLPRQEAAAATPVPTAPAHKQQAAPAAKPSDKRSVLMYSSKSAPVQFETEK